MVKVAALSCAAAVAVTGGLSLQLAHGNDPTLGPKADAIVAARKAPRPQRIIRTTIVRKEMPPKPSSSTRAVAPTTSSSAPVTSAPVAPVAPAPAPAPAPVQTSTS